MFAVVLKPDKNKGATSFQHRPLLFHGVPSFCFISGDPHGPKHQEHITAAGDRWPKLLGPMILYGHGSHG
jgi:hypothetical protein